MTVGGAFNTIRQHELGERIIYFYVVDETEKRVGVLPTRRMLASSLETPLRSSAREDRALYIVLWSVKRYAFFIAPDSA
jgi:Mg/Co/Ni transporter MgtE